MQVLAITPQKGAGNHLKIFCEIFGNPAILMVIATNEDLTQKQPCQIYGGCRHGLDLYRAGSQAVLHPTATGGHMLCG